MNGSEMNNASQDLGAVRHVAFQELVFGCLRVFVDSGARQPPGESGKRSKSTQIASTWLRNETSGEVVR